MISIQTIIAEEIAKEQEEKKHAPPKRWAASMLGKCLCAAYLNRSGEKPTRELDERTYRVFSVGNKFEAWLVDLIQKSKGVTNAYQPETQYIKQWDLAVRPDLYLEVDGEKVVYEIKTVHSQKFSYLIGTKTKKGEGPDKHYLMQLWCGMYAMGAKKGVLVYLSKDDLRVAEYQLELSDPEISQACLEDIATLNSAWQEKIPPKPRCVGTWLEKYCDFGEKCKEINNKHYK